MLNISSEFELFIRHFGTQKARLGFDKNNFNMIFWLLFKRFIDF